MQTQVNIDAGADGGLAKLRVASLSKLWVPWISSGRHSNDEKVVTNGAADPPISLMTSFLLRSHFQICMSCMGSMTASSTPMMCSESVCSERAYLWLHIVCSEATATPLLPVPVLIMLKSQFERARARAGAYVSCKLPQTILYSLDRGIT